MGHPQAQGGRADVVAGEGIDRVGTALEGLLDLACHIVSLCPGASTSC
jgi:hypothetical protein